MLAALRAVADPLGCPGMARVGIDTSHALGVSVPTIRRIAKRAGRTTPSRPTLWATGIHEARMVAALVADPNAFPFAADVARGRADLDSWDITDMLADTFARDRHADRAIRRLEPRTARLHQALRVRDDRAAGRVQPTDPTTPSEICSR